jgi:poly(A) polymerase
MPKEPETAKPDRLPPMPWMSDPATRTVIEALEARGGPGAARFVGGCVRNALLDREIDDIDIATVLAPKAVMAALKAGGVKYVPTGVAHGTVTAIASGKPFEVTTLRRDVETDGRRAVVAFTTDWAEDAQRRDFRLNALYVDGEGRIYDPTGAGVDDALAGRIVFVGDPETRIREDYLRILRFFRFRAWFGRGEPDAAGLAACAALKEGLRRLSAERVSKELLKLLAAEDPRAAVGEMAEAGALQEILPEAGPLDRFNALTPIESDPELRLAALLPPDPALAAAIAERLRLSNAQRERLRLAVESDPEIAAGMTPAAARRRLFALGARAFADRVKLAWAKQGREAAAWRALLALAQDWTAPKFPLTGHDAAAIGVKPGRALGEALRRAQDHWMEQDFRPDREMLIAWLKDQDVQR